MGNRRFFYWPSISRVIKVLRPTWVATLIICLVAILFRLDQSSDVLRQTLAVGDIFTPQQLSLFLGVITLGIWGWLFPRILLSVRYWNTPIPIDREEGARFKWFRDWYPRLTGSLPYFIFADAFRRINHETLGTIYLVLGISFVTLLLSIEKKVARDSGGNGYHELPRWILIPVAFIAVASLSLTFWLINDRTDLPQTMGSAAMLLYASASWLALGSILSHFTYRHGTPPLLVLLILIMVMFGQFNDHHQIRKAEDLSDDLPLAQEMKPVEEHFLAWVHARRLAVQAKVEKNEHYPVFVVTAEGGGLRAAYWTASVLARLEDEIPGFVCHIYAISAVSGGSLGAAIFDAIIADRLKTMDLNCSSEAAPIENYKNPANALEIVHAVLEHDFLAPTLAGMLFPDMLQNLLPLPNKWLKLPDRATYLEEAWEKAWEKGTLKVTTVRSKTFSENFLKLWENDPTLIVPALFMNGTWLDTGSRAITSNLILEKDRFLHAEGVLPLLQHPIRLSTAVHMSARFTYISPAATISLRNGKKGYIVDGGYFENSGARTAAEVLDTIKGKTETLCRSGTTDFDRKLCRRSSLTFIPIIITNDGENLNNPDVYKKLALCPNGQLSNAFMRGLFAPWKTLYNTRSARGYMEERALEYITNRLPARDTPKTVDPGEQNEYHRYALRTFTSEDILVSWMLNTENRKDIKDAINHLLISPDLIKGGQQLGPYSTLRCHTEDGQPTTSVHHARQ